MRKNKVKSKIWFNKEYRSFATRIRGSLVIWSERHNGWIDPEEHPSPYQSTRWQPTVWRDRHFSKWYKIKGKRIIEKLSKKKTSNFGICHYHLCRQRTKVFRCKFCEEYFCKKHIKPKLPGIPRPTSTKIKDKLFMEEWRKPYGHPCMPFSQYWKRVQDKKEREYGEALDMLIRSKPITERPVEREISRIEYEEPKPIRHEEKVSKPKKPFTKYIIGGIIFLAIIGLIFQFRNNLTPILLHLNCTDGTLYDHCSSNKPYYCSDGNLIENASICGCPYDYKVKGDICEKIKRCSDGTIYGECSSNKPYYCLNTTGILIAKASICGCPIDEVRQDEICISKYEVGPKEIKLSYINGFITYTVYKGLNDYLASLPRSISYYPDYESPPTTKDFIMRDLDNEEQKKMLDPLVDEIKKITSDRDDQARIAIRLVQSIPYDWNAFTSNIITGKYPYEVLYTKTGVCSEKANLMIYLLRGLSYGVAALEFTSENHRAVGIKCPSQYEYKNTGYCFVEPTELTTIGDSSGYYVGVGPLTSNPEVIVISDGYALKSLW